MKEKKDYLLYFLRACLLLCTIFIIIGVFRGSVATLHSDTAIASLLAREQLITGQLIPSTWYYAYEYWILEINLLILPFLKLTNDMILSKELAVVVQLFLLELASYSYLKKIVDRRWATVGTLLVISPLSFLQMEHFYFQATYATSTLWTFVILLLAHQFFESTTIKKEVLWGTLMSGLIIVLGGGGTRMLGTVVLPLLGGLVISNLLPVNFNPLALLKEKRTVCKLIVVVIAAAGSFLMGQLLLRLGQTQGSITMEVIQYHQLIERFHSFVVSFFQVYGAFEAKVLMSLAGVMGLLKIILAFLSGILFPIILLLRFPKLHKHQQIFVVYSVLAFIVVAYLMIFCGLTNSYYIIPIYVNNMGLLCIFIDHFQEQCLNLLLWGVLCLLVPVGVYSCQIYARYNYAEVTRWANFETVDEGLLAFLQEEGLEFGYSDFFRAQAYTVASNGEVEIVGVEEHHALSQTLGYYTSYLKRPHDARKWLSSQSWYTSDYHVGECFILVLTEFLDSVESQYLEKADRILTYNQYSIIVLPENLMSYEWY